MSSMTQPIQGMSDISFPEVAVWQRLEREARWVMALYGFTELRTPILEHETVFTRSLGETTDVVQKEMYAFEDRGGRHLCLRPEGTAGVMRHASGLGGQEADGARWYYIGPMFRCERPQAGRKRQFHQCGLECLEPPSPLVDAEILALQIHLLQAWGLTGCRAKINTRGSGDDHQRVAQGLRTALAPHLDVLCEDCRRRVESNVLRVLDCKNETCGKVAATLPPVTEFMAEESRAYLKQVGTYLTDLGISFEYAPNLVRGLDYYEHTIWEISHEALGAQNAVAGGGRYAMQFGNKHMRGVGFAIGVERVISILQALGTTSGKDDMPTPPVCLIAMGDQATKEQLRLLQYLRGVGISARMEVGGSMKSQMRAANRHGANWVLIRGETECAEKTLVVKKMSDGTQEIIPFRSQDLEVAISPLLTKLTEIWDNTP